MQKSEFFRRRDWQCKMAIGFVVFGLFAAFCIFQFVRFDSAKRNPRYTTDVNELDLTLIEEFDEKDLADLLFPEFVVCPTFVKGQKANITNIQCTFISGSKEPMPLTSINKVGLSIFTPRNKAVFWDTCYAVSANIRVETTEYYKDFVDCTVTTEGNLFLHVFPEGRASEVIPQDNTKWMLLKQGIDSNIGLKRTRRIKVDSSEESSEWMYTLQEQDDLVAGDSSVVFTLQYAFLGSANQQGFYPYDFWIMCGIIGGTYMIFYATFAALTFCIFQFLNIKEPEEYDRIQD